MVTILATANVLNVSAICIGLFGGLALFLFGMDQMSEALRAAAGDRMKNILARLTGNRFKAVVAGAFVTAVIQSSSVTTVLVVGFISAGLMSLSQSIGVIMGANIGTTATAQIVAFKVTEYALVLVAVGFLMSWVSKRDEARQYGRMLLGLGLIFLGMHLMSDATKPLRTYEPFIELMQRMDHPLLGILVGAAFTALVQSSSATTGIVIMLASQGFLSLEAGITLALGSNIGTCVTALLAALGKPAEAVRASVVHVLFNVLGVLVWLPFVADLAEVAQTISPASMGLTGTARLAAEAPRQIANANTIFNVANTVVLIWFTYPLAKLVQWLVPDKPTEQRERIQPRYLDEVYLETPDLALQRVRLELGHLGECVVKMLEAAPPAVMDGTEADLRRVERMDDDVDGLYAATLDYIRRLARAELPTRLAEQLQGLLRVADHLETIGDLIETNLVSQGRQRLEQRISISPSTRERLRPLYLAVVDATQQALRALADENRELAQEVIDRKSQIDQLAHDAIEHLGQRLLADDPNRVEVFRFEADLVGQIRRLYYNAKRIAKILTAEIA